MGAQSAVDKELCVLLGVGIGEGIAQIVRYPAVVCLRGQCGRILWLPSANVDCHFEIPHFRKRLVTG